MSAPIPTQYCSTGLCPPTTSDESTTLTSTSAELNAPSPPLPSSSTFDSTTVLDPLLDASTFTAPRLEITQGWRVVIEFCDRCRWLHRAAWVQTELFLTFPPPALVAISLIPLNTQETGGRFRVWLFKGQEEGKQGELVWDRKIEGGFPELKLLKQRIRNHVSPAVSLGHSDKTSGKAEA
ncbi:Rdx family-domain-containing protein [Mrakia frigida]|uniref:SelT/SelW/SelH family protein n=1 Tax=Mrakia frigida TaxID=29902 RepID=UPI003FCBF4F2